MKDIADKSKKVLAICDGCGREIMEDEVAWLRYGVHCYDCCKIIWEEGIENLPKPKPNIKNTKN